MRAEYQDFNGDWFKSCSKCKKHYGAESFEGLFIFFAKDNSKVDGLEYSCKECKRSYRNANKDKELRRWKSYYRTGSDARYRHMVRAQTRKKYGSAKDHKCQRCNAQASEWHHLEYKTDSVIALCEECHHYQEQESRPAYSVSLKFRRLMFYILCFYLSIAFMLSAFTFWIFRDESDVHFYKDDCHWFASIITGLAWPVMITLTLLDRFQSRSYRKSQK